MHPPGVEPGPIAWKAIILPLDQECLMKKSVIRTIKFEEGRITAVVDAIIASMLYFELDGLPNLEAGKFQCSGYIYCRADLQADGLCYLYKRLQDTLSWFYIQGDPIKCVDYIPKSATI